MIDAVDSFRHKHSLLLSSERLRVIAHYVIQSRQHSETLRDLGMHGAIHIIQKIQRLADQFVSVLQITLLDLALAGGVKVVRIAGLKEIELKYLLLNAMILIWMKVNIWKIFLNLQTSFKLNFQKIFFFNWSLL